MKDCIKELYINGEKLPYPITEVHIIMPPNETRWRLYKEDFIKRHYDNDFVHVKVFYYDRQDKDIKEKEYLVDNPDKNISIETIFRINVTEN